MKKKIITLILGLLLVVSIAGNVYQINLLNSKIYSLDNCNVEKNDLLSDLDEKENLLTANSEKIVSLEMEMTDLQSEIETIKNNSFSIETASTTPEEPEPTEDAKSSDNPFSGMTYDELGAIDTTNFTDADWNNYIEACQEAEAALAKNKPATEKQPWTGKPFEEMTQEELNAIDDETYYNLPKEDQDRWLKRYNETIVEKGEEFDQQNQNSGNTTTPATSGDDAKWANPPEKKPIEPDGWLCY